MSPECSRDHLDRLLEGVRKKALVYEAAQVMREAMDCAVAGQAFDLAVRLRNAAIDLIEGLRGANKQ
jgi:hypothetical protein